MWQGKCIIIHALLLLLPTIVANHRPTTREIVLIPVSLYSVVDVPYDILLDRRMMTRSTSPCVVYAANDAWRRRIYESLKMGHCRRRCRGANGGHCRRHRRCPMQCLYLDSTVCCCCCCCCCCSPLRNPPRFASRSSIRPTIAVVVLVSGAWREGMKSAAGGGMVQMGIIIVWMGKSMEESSKMVCEWADDFGLMI